MKAPAGCLALFRPLVSDAAPVQTGKPLHREADSKMCGKIFWKSGRNEWTAFELQPIDFQSCVETQIAD